MPFLDAYLEPVDFRGIVGGMYHSGNQLIDPHLLFDKTRLSPGMHIADFGCGRTGHIVFPGAMVVGERGVVYAVDILKSVLEEVDKRAKMENLTHVHTIWSDLEKVGKTAIPSETLDTVFIINMLYHTKDHTVVCEEAKRLLKNKARIVVVDWIKNSLPFGPTKEQFVNFDSIREWAQREDFAIQEEFPMGQYHWAIVLYRHI